MWGLCSDVPQDTVKSTAYFEGNVGRRKRPSVPGRTTLPVQTASANSGRTAHSQGVLGFSSPYSLAHSRFPQTDADAGRWAQVQEGSGGSRLILEVTPFNPSLLPFPWLLTEAQEVGPIVIFVYLFIVIASCLSAWSGLRIHTRQHRPRSQLMR